MAQNAQSGTITPVILAGGSGTRLWPLSRKAYPKQFLSIGGQPSLLQQTLQRIKSSDLYGEPVILTHEDYRFLVAEQAREINAPLRAILLEPSMRNTAPAMAAVCAYLREEDSDPVVHVMPSDHVIEADKAYWSAVKDAARTAAEGYLVTFGIKPTSPHTGYGYIKLGEALASGSHKVARFVEKPDEKTALTMLDEGGYVWNSGMFLFSVNSFAANAQTLAPEVWEAASGSVAKARPDLDFVRLDAQTYATSPTISVDYALFEKTDRAAVVPAPIVWSDLGTWKALHEYETGDEQGNVVLGKATLVDTSNALVVSDTLHVAVQGLDNICVVATDDSVYVAPLDRSEEVKTLVQTLQDHEETKPLTETHRTCYRPWGGYSSILNGTRFQVKRLFVKPGAKLSLQKHHHRAEHWVVVRGTAEVTIDDHVQLLMENQSVYIPQGSVHRLANPGKILLELIEVQSGSYLGEDDIIRLEDDFNREERE
jgi:mannose-1-phosphate guanylyltransferase